MTLSLTVLSAIIMSAIMVSAIMLNIVMLNGVMLDVIMLSVVAPILVGVISNGREPKKLFSPLTLDFQFNFFKARLLQQNCYHYSYL